MFLIGEKFVTYLMKFEGETAIVKMDDYPVPGRENTRSYREYLAFRLASQIGLRVPRTTLRQHPRYGRLSVQRYVRGATIPTPLLLERTAISSRGLCITLFDVLCGNHDRKLDNLLQLGADIIPIDFNTAFQTTTTDCDFDEETEMILARWFRIRGILSLTSEHRSFILGEVCRIAERLDDAFVRACLAEIPPDFCDPAEAEEVREFLIARRDRLHASVSAWWNKTVAPLHEFGDDALAIAIREHTR